MTDVKTKAGREALRALKAHVDAPLPEGAHWDAHGEAHLMIVATEALIPILDALDEAEATIARLTAEVTYSEASRAYGEIPSDNHDVFDVKAALTAFLEARKGEKK